MVNSNERGRAFEYKIAKEVEDFARKQKLGVEFGKSTERLNSKQKAYFDELDEDSKQNFGKGAKAFIFWLKEQDFFKDLKTIVIDRVADDEAKTDTGAVDLRLIFVNKANLKEIVNFSIKNESDSLCHPRLPSVPEQCGIKNAEIDKEYFDGYTNAWYAFMEKVKKEFPNALTYTEIDEQYEGHREKFLYKPLQLNLVKFLDAHKSDPQVAKAFFKYLVGKNNYYVIKNTEKVIELKKFFDIKEPKKFEISYPYIDKKGKTYFTSCLLSFDNGWKIKFRVHTASSKLYKLDGDPYITEKMDPLCINLFEKILIKVIKK